MIADLIQLLPGLWVSIQLTICCLLISIPLGMLGGIGLASGSRPLRGLVIALTEIGRGFPALVLLYLVYFGLPQLGIVLDGFLALVVAFGYSSASYTAEIFKSALQSVPSSQREAASALGMPSSAAFIRIIFPQAFRICLPAVIGFWVILFQATALAYSIGLRDLLNYSYDKGALSFEVLYWLVLAAVLYLAVSLAMGAVAKYFARDRSASVRGLRIARS